MRLSFVCTAVLSAFAFLAPSLQAQVTVMNPPADQDRRGSNVIMFGESTMVFLAIDYSGPQWKAEYDKPGALEQYKGQNVRLGKNWWTTLSTNVALEIGGATLQPGTYFLGLKLGEDAKSFQLLAFEASTAMKQNLMPFMTDGWKGGTAMKIDFKRDSLAAAQQTMAISIRADEKEPTKGKFSIQWGKHELSADVKIHMPGKAKEASGDKGGK